MNHLHTLEINHVDHLQSTAEQNFNIKAQPLAKSPESTKRCKSIDINQPESSGNLAKNNNFGSKSMKNTFLSKEHSLTNATAISRTRFAGKITTMNEDTETGEWEVAGGRKKKGKNKQGHTSTDSVRSNGLNTTQRKPSIKEIPLNHKNVSRKTSNTHAGNMSNQKILAEKKDKQRKSSSKLEKNSSVPDQSNLDNAYDQEKNVLNSLSSEKEIATNSNSEISPTGSSSELPVSLPNGHNGQIKQCNSNQKPAEQHINKKQEHKNICNNVPVIKSLNNNTVIKDVICENIKDTGVVNGDIENYIMSSSRSIERSDSVAPTVMSDTYIGENVHNEPHFNKDIDSIRVLSDKINFSLDERNLLAETKDNITNEDPKISLDQSSVAAEPAPDLISNLVPLYRHENSQKYDISPINSDSSKNFQENTQKVETGTWIFSRSFAQPRFTIIL